MRKNSIKSFLVFLWNCSVDYFVQLVDFLFHSKDKLYCLFNAAPKVLSIPETIQLVIDKKLSVSRFGDAEIKLISGKSLLYQTFKFSLQQKLIHVLSSSAGSHLICLSGVFSDLSIYDYQTQKHWEKHLSYYRKYWYRYLQKDKIYGNAMMSRCYIGLKNKSLASSYFILLKKIWNKRDVLLVEGEMSRLGVGNDLFDNTLRISRILAPNTNAYDYYDQIIEEVQKYDNSCLVLLALGPTATILAYDLAEKNYQAIDIGHVDIEYEWFRMGASHKVPVPNKFVNEAGFGKGVGDSKDQKYLGEIVCRF